MRKLLPTLTALLTLSVPGAAALADPTSLVNAPGVYTLTNLHPDIANQRLYSTNYQLESLIPVCSEVEIKKLTKKKLVFAVKGKSVEYEYLYHAKSTPEGFHANIEKYFGTQCPKAEIDKLGKADQDGIRSGRPVMGMTRRGIQIAMGYPPEHATPGLDADLYMYWRNKFGRRSVRFDAGGKVDEIR